MDLGIISLVPRKKPACPGQDSGPTTGWQSLQSIVQPHMGRLWSPERTQEFEPEGQRIIYVPCAPQCCQMRVIRRLEPSKAHYKGSRPWVIFIWRKCVLSKNILNSPTWYTGKDKDFGLQPGFNSRVAVWLWAHCLNPVHWEIMPTITGSNSNGDVGHSDIWNGQSKGLISLQRKKKIVGMSGWLSRLNSVWFLILAPVTIPGSQNQAPCWVLY